MKLIISENQFEELIQVETFVNEKRANADTNINETFGQFFTKLINYSRLENIFLSFRRSIDVTDVNPNNQYNTPTGFYTYPLGAYTTEIDNAYNKDTKEINEQSFRNIFPYQRELKYMVFFVLKRKEGVLTKNTPKSELDEYVKRVQKLLLGNYTDENIPDEEKRKIEIFSQIENIDKEIKVLNDKYKQLTPQRAWRFKTKEEFIKDGLWDKHYNAPINWNDGGQMNKYLGEPIPENLNDKCENDQDLTIDNWYFKNNEYVVDYIKMPKVDGETKTKLKRIVSKITKLTNTSHGLNDEMSKYAKGDKSFEVYKLTNSFLNNTYVSNHDNSPTHDTHKLWLLLYDIALSWHDKMKANRTIVTMIGNICKKIGINGFVDNEGNGYIHSNEKKQAVFFRLKTIGEIFSYEQKSEKLRHISDDEMNKSHSRTQGKYYSLGHRLYSVQTNRGVIITDRTGKLFIKDYFSRVDPIANGLFKLIKNGETNFINLKREYILPNFSDRIIYNEQNISDNGNTCIIDRQDGSGAYNIYVVNQDGILTKVKEYDYASRFYDGLAIVRLGNKSGSINLDGKEVIPLKYDEIDQSIGGFSQIKLNGKSGYVDKEGNEYDENKNLIGKNTWEED
jgi:hypothetical protein